MVPLATASQTDGPSQDKACAINHEVALLTMPARWGAGCAAWGAALHPPVPQALTASQNGGAECVYSSRNLRHPPQAPRRMKRKIFVVDDHAVTRKGYAFLIGEEPDRLLH